MESVQSAAAGPSNPPTAQFRAVLQEWAKDHRMFVAALEELAGQLSTLQPPPQQDSRARQRLQGTTSSTPTELLQRVLARAPSERLAAYVTGALPALRPLQRGLPEQLDQNLRLLGVLAAEMRRFVAQLEALADSTVAAALGSIEISDQGDATGSGDGAAAAAGDAALLMTGVLEGIAKETALIQAAERTTLTSPPEEVSAAATVLQLKPFVDETLLAAALEEEQQ
ncbi:hypothetical protein ABPG75_013358 [Micractinium tetrahymenae]